MAAIISLKDLRVRPVRPALRGGPTNGTVLMFTGVRQERRDETEREGAAAGDAQPADSGPAS